MSRGLDSQGFADKVAAVEHHLRLVASSLPEGPLVADAPSTAMVVLHLFQAVQLTIDIALAACARLSLGAPRGYGDAFSLLASAGALNESIARRLIATTGFRKAVAHAYESLDLGRVRRAAEVGPGDLRDFLSAIRPLFAS